MVRTSPLGKSDFPFVVKVGGSLHKHLPELVPVLSAAPRPLLIVPGGGVFADAVRESHPDADSAHWMAVAAMDQFGWLIASHGLPVISHPEAPDSTSVLLPYCCLRHYDPLSHSWDVTSDSIAAWVAGYLGLNLVLLKSVDGIFCEGKIQETVTSPVRTDVVDPFFLPFVLEKKVSSAIINGSQPDRVRKFLSGEDVPGTRIGTTF